MRLTLVYMQALDKAMDVELDVCKAMRDIPMDETVLNQARIMAPGQS